MKYVIILDPGVASREPRGTYPPYDRGISPNIFIKNSSYLPLEGKVSSVSADNLKTMVTTFIANGKNEFILSL